MDKSELKKNALKAIRRALKHRSKHEVKDGLTWAVNHHAYDLPAQYSLTSLLDQPRQVASEILVLYQQCIAMYAPAGSTWARAASTPMVGATIPDVVVHLLGVLKGLENAYRSGEFGTFEETVHADSFGDLITQGEALVRSRFLLPAAVLIGAALEGHLRDMTTRHGLSLVGEDDKRLEMTALNAQLRKAGAYDKTKEAEILGWAHIRNEAAHGRLEQFERRTKEDIVRMAEGVRSFIAQFSPRPSSGASQDSDP